MFTDEQEQNRLVLCYFDWSEIEESMQNITYKDKFTDPSTTLRMTKQFAQDDK